MNNIFKSVILGTGVIFGLLIALTVSAATSTKSVTLTPTNFTAIRGVVDHNSVHTALDTISKSDKSKPFYLFLDTPGGDVIAGRDMVYYLNTTDRNVVCIARTAISMGFHIFEDGCKTRLITSDSILMTHQIAGGTEGHLNDILVQADFLKKLEYFFDDLASKRMGISFKEYEAKLNPEFWTIGSKEVMKANEADSEVSVSCSKELEAVTVDSRSCPLL